MRYNIWPLDGAQVQGITINLVKFTLNTKVVHTWLVGSPNRPHMWGTILLRVKPLAPYLKKTTIEKKNINLTVCTFNNVNVNKHADRTWSDTHIFNVEIRQKQTASLVLLFLCLNPANMRSHTYCIDQVTLFLNIKQCR